MAKQVKALKLQVGDGVKGVGILKWLFVEKFIMHLDGTHGVNKISVVFENGGESSYNIDEMVDIV